MKNTAHDISYDWSGIMAGAAPIGCVVINKDFELISCNQEMMKLFGSSGQQECIDKFYDFSPEFQPCGNLSIFMAHNYIEKAFEEGYCRFEWLHRKLDDELIPAEITLIRTEREEQSFIAGYIRDLRETKAILNDLKMIGEELRLSRDIAREASETKDKFLTNMSHELRTPLNGIIGSVQLIKNTALNPEQADYIKRIEKSSNDLLKMVEDALDFSKAEEGGDIMGRSEFDISAAVSEACEKYLPEIKAKGLDFSLNIPKGASAKVIGDPERFKRILSNFVDNALKFTAKGEISVAAEKIQQDLNYAYYMFYVRDTGKGMPEKQIETLFVPFSGAQTVKKGDGKGLGLALCKKLADMMDGTVWAESEVGEGSTFYLTARFALTDPESRHNGEIAQDADVCEEKNISLKPEDILVLIVDDNEINRMIAADMLKARGMGVHMAEDGLKAVEMVKKENYSLVLMDIQMPVMDGLTATRKIRSMGRFSNLPILAMSAHAMDSDKQKSFESGLNDYIVKPIDAEVFYKTVNKWVNINE